MGPGSGEQLIFFLCWMLDLKHESCPILRQGRIKMGYNFLDPRDLLESDPKSDLQKQNGTDFPLLDRGYLEWISGVNSTPESYIASG